MLIITKKKTTPSFRAFVNEGRLNWIIALIAYVNLDRVDNKHYHKLQLCQMALKDAPGWGCY